MVVCLDALCALGIVWNGRLRVNVVDARDGINEVVVSSKRVPDQSRSACCKAGLSNKCNAVRPEVDGGLTLCNGVSLERNDVSAWRNGVSAFCVTALQRGVTTRVPGGNTFHSPSVSGASTSGSGARSGLPRRSASLGSKRTSKHPIGENQVSTLEVPDLTLNLPPAGDRPLSCGSPLHPGHQVS